MRKFIWLPLLGAATYLVLHFRRQAKLIEKSCFKVVNARINNIGLNAVDIDLKFMYKNLSDIDFYINKQEYEVYVEGKPVSRIVNTKSIFIPANRKSDVWVNVRFNPQEVLSASWEGIKRLLSHKGDVNIGVIGKVSISSGGIFRSTIRIDEETTLKDLVSTTDKQPC